MANGEWKDIAATYPAPVANGVTEIRWAPVTTTKLRIVMRNAKDRAVRLVEAKLF
jgi:hypothetical protein